MQIMRDFETYLSKNNRVTEPQLDELDDKLFRFLDKESTFGKIQLSGDIADLGRKSKFYEDLERRINNYDFKENEGRISPPILDDYNIEP